MESLPLFPLSSIVLPEGRLPLRIFEPRYITMVRDCLKNQTGFGICLILEGAEAGAPARAYPIGTLIKIVDWDRDDSGLLLIVTEGVQKFRTISTEVKTDGLLVGEIELLPLEDKAPVPKEFTGLADLLRRALDDVSPLLECPEGDYNDAVWVGFRLIELVPMPSDIRHDMMAMDDPVERLQALQSFIDDRQNW